MSIASLKESKSWHLLLRFVFVFACLFLFFVLFCFVAFFLRRGRLRVSHCRMGAFLQSLASLICFF